MPLLCNSSSGALNVRTVVDAEVSMFRVLRPLPAIDAKIQATISRCGPKFVAIHVRRTDFRDLFGVKTPDDAFERFVGTHMSAGYHVFVATDNPDTQRHFERICGDRYRALGHITHHPAAMRLTSVADAVADLFVCAAASIFKGTLGSSFSDTIWTLRRLAGTAERDEHQYDRPHGVRPHVSSCSTDMNGLLLEPPLPEALLQLMESPRLGSFDPPCTALQR